MPAVLRSIEAAAAHVASFVISTPNLNFLVNSQMDPEFRESLLLSDLCPTDGMPIVWIARLMGIPIRQRIAGSDIFEALRVRPRAGDPLKIILFGSTEGVAAAASRRLNDEPSGLKCVGWICPGFGDVDELSQDHFIDQINASNADFLVASLGAKKGQIWLQRNNRRLRIPIRAHLGATVNFQAGTVKRAPYVMQRLGLEWLWRIREEPHLWRRYWHDGCVLVSLMLTRILPLAIEARSLRRQCERDGHDLVIEQTHNSASVTLRFRGYATRAHASKAISCFRDAVAAKKKITLDFTETRAADARFFGLLLMLKKQLQGEGAALTFVGVSPRLGRLFRLHGLGYLLSSGEGHVYSVC
jgi:N-acetylglucosaminyldiphosphoundecaprenol N-acetyl-beta-D-mannosaminyltransferase